MIFKSHVFDEPMLEFGDGGRHRDPRQGLREFGPLQPRSGDVVLSETMVTHVWSGSNRIR